MTNPALSVLVLAAGQGKRMNSDLPKVLQTLAGRPLLGHVLAVGRALGAERLTVVYGHGGDRVRAEFTDNDLAWALQSPPRGTGEAVRLAFDQGVIDLQGSVLVLYGDVPLLQKDTLEKLVALASAGKVGLLTQTLANPTGYGRILRDGAGTVQGIVEERDANPQQREISEINTGIMAVPAAHLKRWVAALNNQNAQGEYYLTDVIAMAVQAGVTVETVEPRWYWEAQGINDKRQLAELERAWQRHLADQLLQQGVSLMDPARIDIRGMLTVGRDVSIDVGCVFEGTVHLGDRVRIGPNVVIRDAQIGHDTEVRAMSHLDGVVVGESARIGPFARLRPGTKIGKEGHIGNFVEVKNAVFGPESKANHLAYVGDAELGSRVNIGAGVITCNYDGVNKHRTVIEDDAFIGSDAQLVAPVRVGRGATIAAGTTLTSDAPPEELTVSRARQRSVPGWKRPQKK